jgi:hypothetical protein
LAIKLENEDRLTVTYENVGSRDWMPGWAMGMRVDEVKPNFDVFSLGKLLWSMISGRPRLRLWYHRKPDFDLAQMFPQNDSIPFVQRILDKTVVEEPENCLAGADRLLGEIDEAINAVGSHGRIPSKQRKMRCRFCGLGLYAKTDNFLVSGNLTNGLKLKHEYYVCGNCGHLETFVWRGDTKPGGWAE